MGKNKKLLIVGGVNQMADLIPIAHRNGVSVGVTDYNETTYLKNMADFKHLVNAVDADAVVDLVKQEKYDGIISNFVDMLSPFVTKMAGKLGFSVPFTEEQLLMSTNKKYFKEKCKEYGVPVPKEFAIKSKDDILSSDIEYPVIIKPVDGSGSKGISACYNQEDLLNAYDKAISSSKSGDVIIEEFIDDDEINVTYIVQEGKIQCAAIHDRYFNEEQKSGVHVPDLYIYPSRYTDIYMEKYNSRVMKMFEGIGLENGSVFLQACVRNNQVYFYESGMRLNGCKTYQILEVENDYNTFEHLMNFTLTGSMGKFVYLSPKFKHWYATLNVLGKTGEVIDEFKGIEEVMSFPWLIALDRRYLEKDIIPENSKGTLAQVTTRIQIVADTKEQLIERISKINNLYKILNSKGENIIIEPHNLEDVYKGLNYDL